MRLPAILAMIGGLCLCGALLRPQAAAPYVWTNPLLLEFAAGGMLGMLWVRRSIPGTAIGLFLLCGGVGAYAALEALALHSEPWRFALWGGPAVMIVLGALSLEPAREPRLLRPLRVIGDASYSIYLLNLIVITCVAAAIGTDSPTLFLVVATIATIVSGIGCYRFFEQPAMRALRGARHAAHARKPATP